MIYFFMGKGNKPINNSLVKTFTGKTRAYKAI